MSHIFISYSRKDIGIATQIVEGLAKNALDTWIDWKSIPKGEDWEQEIYRGIEGANAFLFLISPDSVRSRMCNKEIACAIRNGKRILPILIRETRAEQFLHERQKKEISKRNWIFCRAKKDNLKKALGEVTKTIHTDYEWVKQHTELQVKALKWQQNQDPSRLLRGKELREADNKLAGIGSLQDPQPTQLQREYVLASRRSEERQQRRAVVSLLTGMVAISIVATLALWAWQRADILSNLTLVRQLLSQVELLKEKRLDQALLLSVEASRRSDTAETRTALLETLHAQPELIHYIPITAKPRAMGYSSDGNLFVLGDQDGIRLWDSSTGTAITPSIEFKDGHKIFVQGGKLGFSVDHMTIYEWNLESGKAPQRVSGQHIFGQLAGFSPDGTIKVIYSEDDTFSLQEASTGTMLVQIHDSDLNSYDIFSSAFSADNLIFAVSSDINEDPPMATIRTWDFLPSLKEYLDSYGASYISYRADRTWYFTGDQTTDAIGSVSNLILSPDGRYLAVTVQQSSDRVYLLGPEEDDKSVLQENGPSASSLTSGCDGLIAMGFEDGSITAMDNSLIDHVLFHPGQVDGIVYSADCSHLASLGNGTIILWNLSRRDSILLQDALESDRTLALQTWNYSGEGSAASGDEKVVATSTCIRRQVQFDPLSGCIRSEITMNGVAISGFAPQNAEDKVNLVTSLSLNSDGSILAVGVCRDYDFQALNPEECFSGEVWLVWLKNAPFGKASMAFLGSHKSAVTSLSFSPDGAALTSTSQDGMLKHWDMRLSTWQELACKMVGRNFTQQEWNDQFFQGILYPKVDLTCPTYPAGP